MPEPAAIPAARSGCAPLAALLVLALGAALGAAWLLVGLSPWSGALAAGLSLVGAGLLLGMQRELGKRLLALGAVLVLLPLLLRIVLVRGSEQVRLTTLSADTGPRLVSRLYPEPDGTLVMAALLGATGRLRDPESARFGEILERAYARTEPGATLQPTPAVATYLGLQSAGAFDTYVVRPPVQRVAPDAAVVFLHGYAGGFYVYCWEMAQAAAAANLVTLCPSIGPAGAWWEPAGADVVEATLAYAHGLGMNRIYLAGLSNGAAGASVLSLELRGRLAGVVLVSGTRAEKPPEVPVLVVQGTQDQMMPASSARAYAGRRANVRYREVSGGHFIFLSQVERVRPIIAEFLSRLEKQATAL